MWASDIDAAAADFVGKTFGVHTFVSNSDPDDLELPSERFDAIFVGSLFTHLPEATFSRWLSRLLSALDPDGCLAFSPHGFDGPLGVPATESGFHFALKSETLRLETQEYGSSYRSETWLRTQATDIGIYSVRWPKPNHLWINGWLKLATTAPPITNA